MRPRVRALLDRRILVNYRVDPEVVAAVLPAPFRPVIIGGHAIAGICLIRLGQIRPAGLPPAAGRSWTENAAHRFAVHWDTPDGQATGVFVPRRDTDSRLTALVGGRLFPGWHRRARFAVAEGHGRFRLTMTSLDSKASILIGAQLADRVRQESVFAGVEAASEFFGGPIGYSARPDHAAFDGVRLDPHGWNLRPLAVEHVASSYFDDVSRFPPGSITLDSAFLMRDLDTTWTALPPLPAPAP